MLAARVDGNWVMRADVGLVTNAFDAEMPMAMAAMAVTLRMRFIVDNVGADGNNNGSYFDIMKWGVDRFYDACDDDSD